jgi:hypothetical protein
MNIRDIYQKLYYNIKLLMPSKKVVFEARADYAPNPPIFIIGCYRSGTSLLRRMLDSHSNIACPPESKFIVDLLKMLSNREALEGLGSMGFEKGHVFKATRNYIDYYFMNYAQSKGKVYWADKTPDHVDYVDVLSELFEQKAKFVFIYRNGLDVAFSLYRRHFHVPDQYVSRNNFDDRFAGYANFWAEQVGKMKSTGVCRSGAAFEMRYEDLVTEPEGILGALFDYLGIPYEPAVIDYHKFDHDKGIEDGIVTIRKGIKPSIKNYLSLPKGRVDGAMKYIGQTMEKLGYTV